MAALKDREMMPRDKESATPPAKRVPSIPSSNESRPSVLHVPMMKPTGCQCQTTKKPTVIYFSYDSWPRDQRSDKPMSQMPSWREMKLSPALFKVIGVSPLHDL